MTMEGVGARDSGCGSGRGWPWIQEVSAKVRRSVLCLTKLVGHGTNHVLLNEIEYD